VIKSLWASASSPIAAALVALCMIAGACGAGSAEPAENSSDPYPLTRLRNEAGDVDFAVRSAEELLSRECMAAAGFPGITLSPEFFRTDSGDMSERITPTGTMDDAALNLATAELIGYGPPLFEEGAGVPPLPDYTETELVAFREALVGTTTDEVSLTDGTVMSFPTGCRGQARQTVLRNFEADFLEAAWTIEGMFRQSWRRAEADPNYQQVRDAWSECVADAGFPRFEDPYFAIDYAFGLRQSPTDDPSSEELALATVDATCQAETGVIQAFNAALSASQQDEYLEAAPFEAWFAVNRGEIQNAADTVLRDAGYRQ